MVEKIIISNMCDFVWPHFQTSPSQKYSAMYILHLLTLFSVFGNVKKGLSWLINYDVLTYKLAKATILLSSTED